MVNLKRAANQLKPRAPRRSQTKQGEAGFDNQRENIDPQIKTQVIYTQEVITDSLITQSFTATNGVINGVFVVTGVVEFGDDLNFVGAGSGLPYGEICAVTNAVETAITVAGTAVQVTIFDTNGPSNNTTPDHTNDHITIIKPGVYLINVSATVNSDAGLGSKFEITCKKNDGASDIIPHMDRNMAGGGGEAAVISMSGLATLARFDTIEIWIENETNDANYLVEDISLSVLHIGG